MHAAVLKWEFIVRVQELHSQLLTASFKWQDIHNETRVHRATPNDFEISFNV